MAYSTPRGLGFIPPVVKTLLIINVVAFIAQQMFPPITDWGALHYWTSSQFRPHQLVTMMFLHGNFGHIFFNMLVLYMFGSMLENFWGAKRFFNFYMICGIGASVVTLLSVPFTATQFVKSMGAVDVEDIVQNVALYKQHYTALGASGALMGVMAAFAYLFPNTELIIFPLPIPIKAKYLVPFYFLIDLFGGLGIGFSGDNIAHFAHLGGALIGFLIVVFWNRTNRRNFY